MTHPLLLVALWACTSGDDTETAPDSAEPVDTAANSACAVEEAFSGDVVGTADCTDGVCEVEAGPFWMGAANPARPDQCPPRQVTLSAYAIDRTEVTIARWNDCVTAGHCEAMPEQCLTPVALEEPDHAPVTCIDQAAAAAYCAWVGGRLPTEAEWEKAARGEDGAIWAWGSTAPTCASANFREVTTYCELGPVEVATYEERSAYGLADTVGNVWEWTADSFDAGYYRDAPDTDPPGPTECALDLGLERGECTQASIRGGAFNTREDIAMGAARSFAPPDLIDLNLGFRCAYDR